MRSKDTFYFLSSTGSQLPETIDCLVEAMRAAASPGLGNTSDDF